jgi:hypothetical protein
MFSVTLFCTRSELPMLEKSRPSKLDQFLLSKQMAQWDPTFYASLDFSLVLWIRNYFFGSGSGSHFPPSFGSGSCKKFWILTDPDPQHSFSIYLVVCLSGAERMRVMANLLELRVCFLLATTPAKNVNFKGTISQEKCVELRLWDKKGTKLSWFVIFKMCKPHLT